MIFLRHYKEEKDLFNGQKILYLNSVCFGSLPTYWNQINENFDKIAFGFSYSPETKVEKMVEDFNKFFIYANVEIILQQSLCVYELPSYSSAKRYTTVLEGEIPPIKNNGIVRKEKIVIFHVNFNKNYSVFAQFCLIVLLGEILRLPANGYYQTYFEDYFEQEKYKVLDYIEEALKFSNEFLDRNISNVFYKRTSLQELQTINDPKLFSRLLEELSSARQYSIFVKPTKVLSLIQKYLKNQKKEF